MDLPSVRSGRLSCRSSRRDAGRAFLGLLLAVTMVLGNGLLLAAPAQAADVVTLLDNAATLPPTQTATVSFPLAQAGNADLGKVSVSVLSLRHNQGDLTATKAITPKLQPLIPALVLTVDTGKLPEQGEYDVLLAVQAGSARQLLTVTLTRPAAAVTASATITVTRTNTWWRHIGSTEPKLRLVVSPDTQLNSLSARQMEPEDPQVTVTTDDMKVAPDGSVLLPYTVTGAPDPGTVTRTILLSSPQLSVPITVTFTITTRRSPALIAVALLAGVLLSLLLRSLLPTLTNWRKLQLQRQDLDRQLAAWDAQYRDPDFRAQVQALRTTLRTAPRSQLADVIGKVQTDAMTQLQALQKRLTDQEAAFTGGTVVFRRQWRLPPDRKVDGTDQPGLQAAVDQARADLQAADQALAGKNARASAAAMQGVADAAGSTSVAAVNWGGQVRQGLGEMVTDLANYDRGALASLKVALTPTVQGAPAESPSGAPDPGADPVHDAGTRLGEVHATMERYAAARPYLTALADEADEIVRGLTGYGFSASGTSAAARTLRGTDSARGDDPGVAGGPVAAAVRALIAAASDDIRSVPAGNAADVAALLQRGDLVGAANTALSQHHPPGAATKAGATRLGSTAQAALTSAQAEASVRELRDPAVVLPAARAPVADGLSTVPSYGTLALAGVAAEFLHVIAALAVVLFTGYALFLVGWLGTLQDFTKVITWAFAVDLSVTGLTALVTSRAQA